MNMYTLCSLWLDTAHVPYFDEISIRRILSCVKVKATTSKGDALTFLSLHARRKMIKGIYVKSLTGYTLRVAGFLSCRHLSMANGHLLILLTNG